MYREASDETRITCEPPGRLKVLTPEQRDAYQRYGFISIGAFVEPAWIERLLSVTTDQSRELTESNALFDLESDHTASQPRLRRLVSPGDLHGTYWEFVSTSPVVDLIEDLVGPDIKYHHSKLNFKAPRGGEEVKWHQDIQFWPHTNYSPLTVGVFLSDVTAEMGNVGFVPGSQSANCSISTTGTAGWAVYPIAISSGSTPRAPYSRPAPPEASPSTTVERSTARHPIAPTPSVRYCCRPTQPPTHSCTPIGCAAARAAIR